MKKQENNLPSVADFRRWLRDALKKCNLPASTLSRDCGLSLNLASMFLRDPDRGISLRAAVALERKLRDHAKSNDINLGQIAAGDSDG